MWARKLHDEWSKDCESEQKKPERDRDRQEDNRTQLSPNAQLWIMQKLQTRER